MATRTTTRAFLDRSTWTVSYVVSDNATHAAAVIDPVLDYDFKSGHTDTSAADQVATVTPAGGDSIRGTLRMVSPVVDTQTRNGLVYVDLPAGSLAKAGM